jgi:cell wall-associated NlpC family hydrolase
MTYGTDQAVHAGLDMTNRFADKMRVNASAIDAAQGAHVALRTSMQGYKANAGASRANLVAASSSNATDNATATSVGLENEVKDVLDESAQIERAVTEAADTLRLGQIENDRIRDEIIRAIADTMKAVAATRQIQPPEAGRAAARDLLVRLQTVIAEKTGVAAEFTGDTMNSLTRIGLGLGGGEQSTTASSTGGDTSVASSFNTASHNTGGGGHSGGGGGGGGGVVHKPRLPVAIPPQPGTGVDINLPDGSTVKAPNETAAKAVRSAISQLGVPYVWGGTARGQGLDCSGLTMSSYGEAGLTIPRTAATQTIGAEVPSQADLLPGDLVVWSGHVAMVIGNGQMIEAGDPVQIRPIRTTNAGQSFIGFYRPTG